MENQDRPRSLRGFASMDKEKQRAIASKGGRAAHEKGTAHEFNSNEASMAAKKGHERGTAHEFTSEEARVAGRKGGLARAVNRSQQPEAVLSSTRLYRSSDASNDNSLDARVENPDNIRKLRFSHQGPNAPPGALGFFHANCYN